MKLPSDGEKVWWQEFDVTPRQLEGWSPPLNLMLKMWTNGTVWKQPYGMNVFLFAVALQICGAYVFVLCFVFDDMVKGVYCSNFFMSVKFLS